MDFKTIIKKCIDKDRAAQKVLYDFYVKKMMYIALRYTNDIHSSKDIIQESMLRFFNSIHRLTFENQNALDAYLRKTIVNESLRWIGDHNKQAKFSNTVEPKRTYNIGEGQMNVDNLLNDICNLPSKYRTVFNLFAIEGYSHKEISEKLKIKESSSRSQLTRARAMLQETINKRNNHVERIK